jgi:hypothetical protein
VVVIYDHLVAATSIDLQAGAGRPTEGLRQASLDMLTAVETEHQAPGSYCTDQFEAKLKEQEIKEVDTVQQDPEDERLQ